MVEYIHPSFRAGVTPSVVLNCTLNMGEMPSPLPPFELARHESSHHHPQLLSNLNSTHPNQYDPRFSLPLRRPSDWQPATNNAFNTWGVSPPGPFPSPLIGPGYNPDPPPRSHPDPPPHSHPGDTASARGTSINNPNPRKRKRAVPLPSSVRTSSVGGYGPVSPGSVSTGVDSPSPSPPPPSSERCSKRRRNAADDVWAFALPLPSCEVPADPDRWPASLEPCLVQKPKSEWFGCKLCLQAR